MDHKDLDRFYADNIGLIHTIARKGYRRLKAMGAALEYEDLVQELSIVFVRCYAAFKEASGNKFSTYFIPAAFNRVNSIAEDIERERVHLDTRSIEEMNNDGEYTLEEVIPSTVATPEQYAETRSAVSAMSKKMSPLTATIVGMAIDPPDFIEREFEAAQAHAEYARSIGIERRARGVITVSYVCKVLEKTVGLPDLVIKSVKAQIVSSMLDEKMKGSQNDKTDKRASMLRGGERVQSRF